MKKQIQMVAEFHKAFGGFVGREMNFDISQKNKELRDKLMSEELEEVRNAMFNEDIYQVAKELADMCYVVFGTIETFGLTEKFEEVFDAVHKSNMSKLGSDGKPIYREDGKILKSENYKPADIKAILDK